MLLPFTDYKEEDYEDKDFNLTKDVSAILGKKKDYFLAKPTDLWMSLVSRGPKFHVEVVIKVLYDPSSLIQDLSKLLNDKKVTDVKIICDGETFKCHKAILAARSDVFSAMFEMSSSIEANTGEVKIEDIDAKTMKSLILYMYQNHVPKQDADINLLLAADKYNLADLVLLCQESMMSNISDETVLDIAVSSRLLASQHIFKAAKKFINTRPIESLKDGNAWKMFNKENPEVAKEITQKPSDKKIEKSKPKTEFRYAKMNMSSYPGKAIKEAMFKRAFVFESYDKKVTDVYIICNGEAFKCHKAILSARSDVFAAMFEMSGSTSGENNQKII
jgi:hypothetical protein